MRHLKADAFTNLTPHKLPVENMTARSSSIRQVVLHGAKLNIQQRCVGRVRLPMNRQEDFIREFNRSTLMWTCSWSHSNGMKKSPEAKLSGDNLFEATRNIGISVKVDLFWHWFRSKANYPPE